MAKFPACRRANSSWFSWLAVLPVNCVPPFIAVLPCVAGVHADASAPSLRWWLRDRDRSRQNAASPANRRAPPPPPGPTGRTIAAENKCAASVPPGPAAGHCQAWGRPARSTRTAPPMGPPAPSQPETPAAALSCRSAQTLPSPMPPALSVQPMRTISYFYASYCDHWPEDFCRGSLALRNSTGAAA